MNAPIPTRLRSRFEWWHYVTLFFLALQVAFAVVPRVRPGKLGMVCWYFGSDPLLCWGVVTLIAIPALLWSVWRRPFWRWSRVAGVGLLAVLAAAPFTYDVYPSGNANRVSKVRFRVPFDGPVTVGWGGNTTAENYHVIAPDQRWAYDILAKDEKGSTFRGDGERVEDYLIYDRPVLAPAPGIVVEAVDGDPDMPIGELGGGRDPGGNFLRIAIGRDEFLLLCHLKPGSLRVKIDDVVIPGQEIAHVGNSGNTSEPHLHVHLEDGGGEGLPVYFSGYRSGGRVVERGMPRGGFEIVGDDVKLVGETIEHVGDEVTEGDEAEGSGGTRKAREPLEAFRPTWAAYSVIRTEDTAEDLWARAVWVTAHSHAWADAPENLADRLFAVALVRADRAMKSRILVSMGDCGTSFATVARSWGEVGDALESRAKGEAEVREIARDLAAVPEQAEVLAELMLADDTIETPAKPEAVIEDFVTEVREAQALSRKAARAAYAAAVQADPNNVGAWFRLVWVSEGDAQDAALAEFRRRDPDNALPWIATGVIVIERGDFPAAVAPLQAAADRPFCRLYPSPLPERFLLRFSFDEPFRNAGVAGQPVPPATLREMATRSRQISESLGEIPWHGRVRSAFSWSTAEYIAASIKIGKARQAAALTDAIYGASLKLLAMEPPDVGPFVAARGSLGTAAWQGAGANRIAGDHARANRLQHVIERLDATRAQIRELLPKWTADGFERVVRGELDELAEWQPYMRATRDLLKQATRE